MSNHDQMIEKGGLGAGRGISILHWQAFADLFLFTFVSC